MDNGLVVLLVVLVNAIVLVLGSLITYLAYRAYRRTRSRELRLFTLGFPLLTLGFLVGGGLHQLLGLAILTGILAQSLLTALGLVAFVSSLYVGESEEMISPPA